MFAKGGVGEKFFAQGLLFGGECLAFFGTEFLGEVGFCKERKIALTALMAEDSDFA